MIKKIIIIIIVSALVLPFTAGPVSAAPPTGADNVTLWFSDNLTVITPNIAVDENTLATAAEAHVEELENTLASVTADIIGLVLVLVLFIASFWHRERLLYVLTGFAAIVYSISFIADDPYISSMLLLFGIYQFFKAKWGKGSE